jgi:2-methylcitrate dehydratase PrpD
MSPIGAAAAAFATGVLVHALDFDDTHAAALVHPTAVVLPSALSVGEQTCASGAEVLLAAIAGYEAVCRIGAASPHGFHARGLHATGICGPLASAVVSSRLLGLDPRTAANALGIAGSSSSGLMEFLSTGASTKTLHPGQASMSGIIATRLAVAGASGPDTVFEGPQGLYASLSARPAAADRVIGDLGSVWESEMIAFKPYPACQLLHYAVDAAATLRGRIDPVDEVRELVVEVHPDSVDIVCEPREAKIDPRTAYEAKFSLQWSVAAMLVDGRADLDEYSTANLGRADLTQLASRVRYVPFSVGQNAADTRGGITAVTGDGRVVHSGRVPADAVHIEDAVMGKFRANVGGRSAESDELASRILGIESEAGLDSIMELAAAVSEGRQPAAAAGTKVGSL